jgi:hypothetical protein
MMRWRRSLLAHAMRLIFLCLCGAGAFAQGDPWPGEIEDHFRRLRASIQKDEGPAEIYALLSTLTQRIIEVKKDGTAMLHYDDGNGRTRDRAIPGDELAQLRRWLSEKKVDELPPFDPNISDGIQYEYVHLDRKGTERRVPMNNPPETMAAASSEFGGHKPRAYGALMQRMLALDAIKVPVVYRSLQHLPGFGLVYTATKDEFVTELSFRHGQLLAEVWGKTRTWHVVTDRGIAAKRIIEPRNPLEREWWPKYLGDEYADAAAGPYAGQRLWAGTRQKDDLKGLWASSTKGEPTLIVRGTYGPFVLSPDGEWLVARAITKDQSEDRSIFIARIDLQKKQVIPVTLPEADMFIPIAWMAAHQKVIFLRERSYGRVGPDEREYYLLDVATGNCEKVTGEFRPLTDYNWVPRHLQTSSEVDVFWATIVHEKERPGDFDSDFGKYNTRDFSFTSLVPLPGVRVEPDQIFVDERAKTMWLTLTGDIAKMDLSDEQIHQLPHR